ncbi:hypothetical protein COL922a_010915 [Colletotrichum nupharicola]|nr:hypothetical protein COL922a_010915 [Colletotrichum nupharicola]
MGKVPQGSGTHIHNPEIAKTFYDHQAYFPTIFIQQSEDIKILEVDIFRPPWEEGESLGCGAFGKVYKVKISRDHISSKGLDDSEDEFRVVARKDFELRQNVRENFELEVKAMKKILHCNARHDNILMSLGTLKIESKPPKFSLFMPLADKDLKTLLEDNQYVPQDGNARQEMILSAWGLADGLSFLHEGLKAADGEGTLVCYHMDLKPSNILVFGKMWKLSDFGMSKVKLTHQEEERDLRKLFSGPASKTGNARGEGTYVPNEAQMEGKTMNQKSDVWSLGCILSVLFTYMEHGPEGLDTYGQLREDHSKLHSDVFYRKRQLE